MFFYKCYTICRLPVSPCGAGYIIRTLSRYYLTKRVLIGNFLYGCLLFFIQNSLQRYQKQHHS